MTALMMTMMMIHYQLLQLYDLAHQPAANTDHICCMVAVARSSIWCHWSHEPGSSCDHAQWYMSAKSYIHSAALILQQAIESIRPLLSMRPPHVTGIKHIISHSFELLAREYL